jgi:hypothetical protein
MPHVVLEVPIALVAGLRETVLLQYRATVEALHLALGEGGACDAEVSGGRERLRQLDELLDRLDAPLEPEARFVRLEAEADVLGDALHGSLIDAGERLAVACGGAWRGEGPAGCVRSAAEEVIALDRLLRRLEEG